MGHGREVNTHPQRLGFPSSEQDSLGLFTHCPQTPQRSFQGAAAGTHATPAPNRAHSGSQGETRAFRMGALSLPSERFARFGNPARPGVRTANFAAFGPWSGRSRRTQRACGTAMRLCASLFRGVAAPLGCVICLQLGDVAVFSLCAQYFLNVRGGGGITTLGAFHTVRKPCVARG